MDGSTCEEVIEIECEASVDCCEGNKLYQNEPSDEGDCCVTLETECEVRSVEVNVDNGVLSSANWSCPTALPTDYAGESNYTFYPDGCAVDLTTCVTPAQSGVVTITYLITYMDGSTCEEVIEIECEASVETGCCPLIDFKLRQRWPYFQSHIGVFNITNVDPNTSICSIEINASPAGSFTPVSLIVDGTTSGQSWTSLNIPAVGSLTNPASNNVQFSLLGANYKGVIEVCVTMCDGSVCCYEVNWNGKPVIGVGVGVDNVGIGEKLHAVSIRPAVEESIDEKVKYVSFGYFNEEQAKDDAGFFAASVTGGGDCDDGDPDVHPGAASLGRHNAFFEMKCPFALRNVYGTIPTFNLVFSGDLPEIGCTLFDEDGNIIYSGKINNIESDTVTNSVIDPAVAYEGMLDVVSVYPNPNSGDFTMTYATGSYKSISVKIVNSKGQLISTREIHPKYPGLHEEKFFENNLHEGVYHIIIESDGRSVSKSFIKR
jgi:hypothetical protein